MTRSGSALVAGGLCFFGALPLSGAFAHRAANSAAAIRLVGKPVFLYVVQTTPYKDRFYYLTAKLNRAIPNLSRACGTAAVINGICSRLQGPSPHLCYTALFEQHVGGAKGRSESLGPPHFGRPYKVTFRLHQQPPFSTTVRLQRASPGGTNPLTGTKPDPKLAALGCSG
jgi:hypothetical protein